MIKWRFRLSIRSAGAIKTGGARFAGTTLSGGGFAADKIL